VLAAVVATLTLAAVQPTFLMPAWSPDGTRVAWAQGSGPAWEVWAANADGSRAAPVAPPIDGLFGVAWVSQDELLTTANYRLSRLKLDGTRTGFGYGINVAVDASRSHAAWQSADLCPSCHGPLVVRPLAHGAPVKLGGSAQNASPTFSPDGKQVAFARSFEIAGRWERAGGIWTAPSAGGPLRRIAKSGNCPSWSPDGTHIAYGDRTGIRLVGPEGGRTTLLLRAAKGTLVCPGAWSPDSRSIALPADDGRLVAVAVPSGRVRTLTTPAQGTVTGFSWSPAAGTLLVTARTKPHCSALWLVGSTTRKLRGC
jgi:hypothetical protein